MKNIANGKQNHIPFHFISTFIFAVLFISCTGIMSLPQGKDISGKEHHLEDGFRNPGVKSSSISFSEGIKLVWKDVKNLFSSAPIIVRFNNDGKLLMENKKDLSVTWVGHNTLLVQMDGYNFLTDPIWSERCSPFPFVGPKRFVKPGIDFDKLPKIDFVLISHDHYDHLDEKTVRKLSMFGVKFYVPLKVKKYFDEWKIKNVTEFDWWDSIKVESNGRSPIFIHCTPAQHFSGRGLNDRDKTLWSSWAVLGEDVRFYYGGDTGYFYGFKLIGERFGPFDLVALPIGAYFDNSEHFKIIHENPEEAVQAFLDLKGKYFIPVHWGTFHLTLHSYDEPIIRLKMEIEKRKLDFEKFSVLRHGESKFIKEMADTIISSKLNYNSKSSPLEMK